MDNHILFPSSKETDALIIQLINENLLLHTVQFFYKTDHGLRPYGSGVLVEIGGSHFIFTASHVADYLINNLYIRVTLKSYVQVMGHIRYSAQKESDGIDVAYIKIQNELLPDLKRAYKFMTADKLESHTLQWKAMNYCVLGFPERNFKKVDGRIETGASYFLTNATNDNPYKFYKKDKRHYFFVDMKGKGIYIVSDEPTKINPHLNGISGGGLWHLEYYHDETTGWFRINYKLIGVITEGFHGKYHCLMANRIDLIVEALIAFQDVKMEDIQEYLDQKSHKESGGNSEDE